MINVIAEDSSLQDITIDDISSYLRRTGWTPRADRSNNRFLLFDGPKDDGGRSIVLTLPASKNFFDSSELLGQAINLLAAIEQASPQKIIQKMRSPNRDILYVRVLQLKESIPSLDATSHIIHGLRNLIAYSACMEREVRRYFERPFREGKQQAQHFLFGPTFYGSFGFTVESPIEHLQTQLPLTSENIEPPMERRVIERIARGFLTVQEAVKANSVEIISKGYERGLNANMCSALADILKGNLDTEIEFAVAWSLWLKPSQDVATIAPIRLQGNVYPYLEEAAQSLETLHKAEEGNLIEEVTVRGKIKESISGDTNRTAIVSSDKYGEVHIAFLLESEADRMACDAYRDRRDISIKGTLTRSKRKEPWTLLYPQDFKAD